MAKRKYLGEFEFMVILALIRLKDDAYGVEVSREIKHRCGREVSMGSVYAALERLEEQGLISSALGEPTSERGGRAKRYFHVTDQGIRTIQESRHALNSLWAGVPQLQGTA